MKRFMLRSMPGLVSLLLLAAAGCGGKVDPNRPNTVPVSGTVTRGGQAVEGATVTFQPIGGARGATGRTDKNGRYTVMSFAAGDGAVPGEYKVAVSKYEQLPPPAIIPEEGEERPENVPIVQPKNLLPEKYNSFETSGLTVTVRDGGENKCDFALE